MSGTIQTTGRSAPTPTESGPIELTEAQLDQVVGGGGKPTAGTTGSGIGKDAVRHVVPDGGKGGMQGDMG